MNSGPAPAGAESPARSRGTTSSPVQRSARLLFFLILSTLAGLATWANLDLTGQRAFLFMDEMIPFDNVKRILTAPTLSDLGANLADGGDHRYGRILYNVAALTGVLPFRFGGDSALIISIRTTQVALLLFAFMLLSKVALQSWTARLVALVGFACLPYTDYYSTQPKPEPTQLACYALFLAFAIPRNFRFGGHWIFLGLAFGAKISAAPLVVVAIALGVLNLVLGPEPRLRATGKMALAVVAFIAGWVIAIPMLAVPNKLHVDAYLNWTFRSTGHGSDDARITVVNWLDSILGGEAIRWSCPRGVMIAFVIGLGGVVILAGFELLRRRPKPTEILSRDPAWILLLLAASLILPIVLMVKRLWGMYLFPGQVLGLIACAGLAERAWSSRAARPLFAKVGRLVIIVAVACGGIAACYAGSHAVREYQQLAHRTRDQKFLKNRAIFESATTILRALEPDYVAHTGQVMYVFYDPYLYPPDSSPSMNVQPFWAATIYWEQKPAVILLGREWHLSYFLGEKPLPPTTSSSYEDLRKAVANFQLQVDLDPATPGTKPYQLVKWLGTDAAIVLRRDVATWWRDPATGAQTTPPAR